MRNTLIDEIFLSRTHVNINNGNIINAEFLHLEEPIIEERPFMTICAPTAFEYIKPIGTWQLINSKGEVIEEKKY